MFDPLDPLDPLNPLDPLDPLDPVNQVIDDEFLIGDEVKNKLKLFALRAYNLVGINPIYFCSLLSNYAGSVVTIDINRLSRASI